MFWTREYFINKGGRNQSNIKGGQISNHFCWGKLNDPLLGNTFVFRSSQKLPCLCLEPLKGILSWQGLLQGPLPCVLLPELQRNKYTCQVCRARHGRHTTPSRTTVASHGCMFIKKVFVVPKIGGPWPPLPPPLSSLLLYTWGLPFNLRGIIRIPSSSLAL